MDVSGGVSTLRPRFDRVLFLFPSIRVSLTDPSSLPPRLTHGSDDPIGPDRPRPVEGDPRDGHTRGSCGSPDRTESEGVVFGARR